MAGNDVEFGPVDIDHTVKFLLNYDEEVQNRSKQYRQSIYMVPGSFRDLSPSSFTPRVVSIGPLHHQDEHLKGFEVHKLACMHNLLGSLDSMPEQILEACVTKVNGSIDHIKSCYIGMKTYSDSELVKMMVMDACFILAFIYNYSEKSLSLGLNKLLYPHIFLDMVLIENQIPFFVLQDIFDCTLLKLTPTRSLAYYISQVKKKCHIFEEEIEMGNSGISSDHDHILGFLHKSYRHPDRKLSTFIKLVKSHSVVELERSGVRFSKNTDAKWPTTIQLEFSRFLCFPLSWSKPTLNMPVLALTSYTECLLRNLIIYEHSSQELTYITAYIMALDLLIDTPEDVAELVRSEVIINAIGSTEKATELLNSILKEVPLQDFYYRDEWNRLDEYYNARWPHIIAELRRNYFSNPWSIIALLAGIVLFILTVIQTIYGVGMATGRVWVGF